MLNNVCSVKGTRSHHMNTKWTLFSCEYKAIKRKKVDYNTSTEKKL